MCLYPRLIKNRKYVANKKNKGIIPEIKDNRVLSVPVGCGNCMECKKQKARAWSVRLQEEIRTNKTGKFVTLTLSTESLKELSDDITGLDGYERENEIITLATRRFLERWRKKYKVSVRHWLISELGGGNTEHIHLHGIIWTNETAQTVRNIWKYGHIWPRDTWKGTYVNDSTINYIIKYFTKVDPKHKEYKAKILTSAGIGKDYIQRHDATLNKYKKEGTKETYTTRQGIKLNLPIYYRNKIYTEEEREKLWLERLDKEERWVDGIRIRSDEQYYKILNTARQKNNRLGYGNDEKNWQRVQYENERRNINFKKRMEKLDNEENIT